MSSNWFLGSMTRVARLTRKGCGLALAFVAFSGTAWALPTSPEIDPGSAVSSLALLVGGVMLLRDRYRRR
jgi:hypothetical protein